MDRMRDRIRRIAGHAEESEKATERYLVRRVEELGGLCLKYGNHLMTGYPDRLCMLPGGVTFWAELKSRGRGPSSLQAYRMMRLADLGQRAYVCSSRDDVDRVLGKEAAP